MVEFSASSRGGSAGSRRARGTTECDEAEDDDQERGEADGVGAARRGRPAAGPVPLGRALVVDGGRGRALGLRAALATKVRGPLRLDLRRAAST
jgi:hypothetical protein